MRLVVRAVIPTEAGNRMVRIQTFLPAWKTTSRQTHVSVSYFVDLNDDRTILFIMDVSGVDKIPLMASRCSCWAQR